MQRLIRSGHRHAEILEYTLPQFLAYLQADAALERERLGALLSIIAVGSQGNRESIRKLHRELAGEH